ncbi:MAG: WecB/TagA/CpsF family glycosyltransferase [Chloroflexi bacterium]|nr:WecB/TagA/CpsF family glycosyltransferase [Chloroflexota bacterium]
MTGAEELGGVPRVSVLGVFVHRVSLEESVRRVGQAVLTGRSFQIATVNPEFIMAARRDGEFLEVLRRADLALADGQGVVWASRLLGSPLPERVAGVDLMERLCAWAAGAGVAVYLLGARPGVAERTAVVLQERWPGLQVAGCYAGSPNLADEEEIVGRVRASGARLLFVAYGAPQQDKWIARNVPRLGAVAAMGVGGSFDFLAGVVPRAPLWMQRRGVEWLYRLLRQPWRWRRMLALPHFVWLVLRERGRREASGG